MFGAGGTTHVERPRDGGRREAPRGEDVREVGLSGLQMGRHGDVHRLGLRHEDGQPPVSHPVLPTAMKTVSHRSATPAPYSHEDGQTPRPPYSYEDGQTPRPPHSHEDGQTLRPPYSHTGTIHLSPYAIQGFSRLFRG